MKRVIIVHGWDDDSTRAWFPWLKNELTKKGYEVIVPDLPYSEEPRIARWVPVLAEAIGSVDSNTYFVGHSMGCQTIARFLETLPFDTKVGGVIFVAGFFKCLNNLEDDDTVRDVAREWITTPIDLKKVKSHILKSVAIFSNNDPWVPIDNKDDFAEKLNSEIIVLSNRGHFSGTRDKCFELPEVLNTILDIMS